MKIIGETERLLISTVSLHDDAFILELLNTKTWLDYIGDRKVNDIDAALRYIESKFIAIYKTHGFGIYKVSLKSTKEDIGIAGFVQRDYLNHPDLGFALLPRFEKQGYCFEACVKLCQIAKKRFGWTSLLALTNENNLACIRLLHKLKFKKINKTFAEQTSEQLLILELILSKND